MPDPGTATITTTPASGGMWSGNWSSATTVSGAVFWSGFASGWEPSRSVGSLPRREALWDLGASFTSATGSCAFRFVAKPTAEGELRAALAEAPKGDPASLRARELLREALATWQRNDFDAMRSFRVIGASGRTYRVDPMRHRNVKALRADGRVEWVLCASPADDEIPVEDVMLAQKLLLEADEAEFLRRSNCMLPSDLSRLVEPNPLLSAARGEGSQRAADGSDVIARLREDLETLREALLRRTG